MFDLWNFGHKENNVGPYRFIEANVDLIHSEKVSTTNLSKAKTVMNELEFIAIEKNLITCYNDLLSKSVAERDTVFKTCLLSLLMMEDNNIGHKRIGQIKYRTVYEEYALDAKKQRIVQRRLL